MQKRSSTQKKRAQGDTRIGKSVARMVAGNPIVEDPLPMKDPAAVVLGRLRGLKGGKARDKKGRSKNPNL